MQTLDGSELITRWDIQEAPPDILITNYSMLSIMLLRDREQRLLDETREWIKESEHNRFYLVVDELHSYRGTGGTEISYTIRAFLDRIGLSPRPPAAANHCNLCVSFSRTGTEVWGLLRRRHKDASV